MGVQLDRVLVTAKAKAYDLHNFHNPFTETLRPVEGGGAILEATTPIKIEMFVSTEQAWSIGNDFQFPSNGHVGPYNANKIPPEHHLFFPSLIRHLTIYAYPARDLGISHAHRGRRFKRLF